MSLYSQVVLTASSTEATPLTIWDLHTGTQLAAFKGNGSGSNCVCAVGRDYVAAAQMAKDSLHFWTWHKEAILQRCFVAEKLTAIVATPSGAYVAAGGASGNLYIWNSSTGRLLLGFKAHYKAIKCLAFTDRGHTLVTAGDDTIVNAWAMTHLLDANALSRASRDPTWSWSQHTLPVTGLAVGAGEASPRVITCSMDQTCRVWSTATGACLQTLLLPAPLTCTSLHWTEQGCFVGAADSKIYHVALSKSADGAADAYSAVTSGGGAEVTAMVGHTQAVTCLSLDLDGALLVSGSLDGSVRVWDTATKQMLRILVQPGKLPVHSVLVVMRPPYLLVTGNRATKAESTTRSIAKPARSMPLGHFAKLAGSSTVSKAWEDGIVLLDGSQEYGDIIGQSGLLDFCERAAPPLQLAADAHDESEAMDTGAEGQGSERAADLEKELALLKHKYATLYAESCTMLSKDPAL